MSYDASKVAFTDEEHRMAAALDNIIEQFSDGFQFDDLAAIIGAAPLIEYLAAGGDRVATVARLLNMATMLERDNSFIEGLKTNEEADEA